MLPLATRIQVEGHASERRRSERHSLSLPVDGAAAPAKAPPYGLAVAVTAAFALVAAMFVAALLTAPLAIF